MRNLDPAVRPILDDAAANDASPPTTEPVRPARRALLKTSLLATAIVVAASALLPMIDLHVGPVTSLRLEWWAIALIAIASELMVFNIEFRREVYTFTFSEVPLVLGLLLAPPAHLIVGRLVGEVLFLVIRERQSIRKLTLNLAVFYGECIVLLGVHQLLGQGRDSQRPLVWGAAMLSVFAADMLGFIVVAKAVKWHGGPLRLRSILAIGAVTAPVNTSLALVAVILLDVQPWAALLLIGVAAFVLLSYRSYTALRQRYDSLSLLYDFTRMVSGAQEPDVVLESILGQAKDLLRAERAEIWLADDRGGYIGLTVDDDGRTTRVLPLRTGASIAAWFHGCPETTVITADATDAVQRAMADELDANECLVAPITEAGVVVGLISVVNRLGAMNEFRAQEGPVFATLANHASVALENGRLIARLHEQSRQHEHESLHDGLTGLPNRMMFGERLNQMIDEISAGTGSVGVAIMDLDGFKEINDTLGHQYGDLTLIDVARRIERVIRPSMMVARLGGDEFALLVPGISKRAEVETVARRIRRELAVPFHIDGVRIKTGISIGIAIAPIDGSDAAAVLQRADVAMYGAKAGLGDGVNFYDATSDTNTPRRFTLVNDLHSAVANGELSLVYQPKVRVQDGVMVGVESLARWTHPKFGSIGPDEFIPLAERSGVIVQITEFVLETALRQTSNWHRQGRSWGVSVNLSMRNLLDTDLVSSVERLLHLTEVEPASLTLEITETNIMADTSRTIDVLQRLSDLGVRLSIDDFGTGYSSLSYLQRLPVDEIKIDKLFVLAMANDAGAASIVRSILDLGRNMGLCCVAEGIEDRATWNRLRAMGCDQAQGFYLAHPMVASDLVEWTDQLARLGLGEPSLSAPVVRPTMPRRTTIERSTERTNSCGRRLAGI